MRTHLRRTLYSTARIIKGINKAHRVIEDMRLHVIIAVIHRPPDDILAVAGARAAWLSAVLLSTMLVDVRVVISAAVYYLIFMNRDFSIYL